MGECGGLFVRKNGQFRDDHSHVFTGEGMVDYKLVRRKSRYGYPTAFTVPKAETIFDRATFLTCSATLIMPTTARGTLFLTPPVAQCLMNNKLSDVALNVTSQRSIPLIG